MLYEDFTDNSSSMSFIRHFDEELILVSHQLPDPKVAVNLGIFGVVVVDDVLPLELCAILVEAVCKEERNIVEPCIARRSREHDPAINPGDLDKRISPGPRSNSSLLVENEECIPDVRVPSDVVP